MGQKCFCGLIVGFDCVYEAGHLVGELIVLCELCHDLFVLDEQLHTFVNYLGDLAMGQLLLEHTPQVIVLDG